MKKKKHFKLKSLLSIENRLKIENNQSESANNTQKHWKKKKGKKDEKPFKYVLIHFGILIIIIIINGKFSWGFISNNYLVYALLSSCHVVCYLFYDFMKEEVNKCCVYFFTALRPVVCFYCNFLEIYSYS